MHRKLTPAFAVCADGAGPRLESIGSVGCAAQLRRYLHDLEALHPGDRATDIRFAAIDCPDEHEEMRSTQLRVAAGCLTKEEWLCLCYQTQY